MLTNFDKFVKNIRLEDYQSMAGPDWPDFEQLSIVQNLPQFVIDELSEMFEQLQRKEQQVKTFCILPFYGTEYPGNTACCLMPPNTDLDQVRKEMIAGQRPIACNKCWRLEDQKIFSDRLSKNSTLDRCLGKDIFEIFDECKNGNYYTCHYKIDTSNTCNAACVTCSSTTSSTWGKILRKHNQKASATWQLTAEDKALNIDYNNAKYISFRGGEPTLSKTNFDILKKLLDCDNRSCFISFITNGSFKLTRAQTDLLTQFDTVNFCFSVDGIGKVFEYMRYPLCWDDLLKNLDYCRNNGFIASVNYTVSNLNVIYHLQTVDWFKSTQLEYIVNPVYDPIEYNLNSLPQNIKNHIINQIPELSPLFTEHESCHDVNFELFKQEIAKQDLWKGINIADYLPEFASLIK